MGNSFAAEFRDKNDETGITQVTGSRFTVMECISETNLGDTFLVSENETGKLYILKSQRNTDATQINESDLLNGLEHKGLPKYEPVISHDNIQYTLRRYLEGKPLDEYLLSADTVNISEVVDIFISLCDVLSFLHSQPQPIIHRDIKPSNIIIDKDNNTVTLIDFGISRRYQESAENDTVYFGTHKFAPPEQYGFAQTDCRTDIYSLGVVMRYWFIGDTDKNVKIQDRTLEHIVSKCTELAPESRYQSITALRKALLKYKTRGKRRVLTTFTCLAAAVVLGFGIPTVLSTRNNNAHDPPLEAVYQTPVGYDDIEYQRLVAFFLHEDNLEKIKSQHSGFDIENPATWHWERGGTYFDDDGLENPVTNFILWERRNVIVMYLVDLNLTGILDLSDFKYLRVLDVADNNLEELNLSSCISLTELRVDRDILASLDLSELSALEFVS
ncbi:MAG: protein kinase [Oscillospiraceae bacterium]|nr:protein kinase [Oscillospiraceae bacterium]